MAAIASEAQVAPRSQDIADGELVRRVRRGDEQAFELLYHRYHRRITAYIHGMVHDHARSEDVAQDVFVSALRRMRETDRPIAFKPWIYEIAKNACIDQFRRSRRAEEVSYDADEGLGAADYGRLTSNEALPETRLESKQSLDHLRGAFGGLSETHHEILVMRELEGLSYREIGERLGMSRPSVESTLFRARRRLTEEYEELVSGARCQRIQGIIAVAAATAPGARDQRRLARHVSHCQPCRRQARMAGLDIPVTPDRPVRQRIAAMLPLPLFLRKRWLGEGSDAALGSGQLHGFAQWSAQLGATMDPSWFKAAATAVTVAVAGASAGLAGSTASPRPVGTFGSVLPTLSDGDGEHRVTAGLRPTIAPALVTTTTALAAPAADEASTATETTAAAPAAPASGDGGSAEATTDAATAPPTVAGSLQDVVDQATTGLTGADTGSGSGQSGGGSGGGADSGDAAGSSGTPELSRGEASAPELALPTTSDPAVVTPEPTSSAPDPAAALDEAAGATGAVQGTTGALTGQ